MSLTLEAIKAAHDGVAEMIAKFEAQQPRLFVVQRHLTIGYNRAARLIEAMESCGVLSGTQGIYTVSPVAPGAGASA